MVGYTAVSLSTIREDFFNDIATFIDASKPTGWKIFSSFPEEHPFFPCIIINPALISFRFFGQTRGKTKQSATITIELFSEAKDSKQKIDSCKDTLQAAFISGFSTLRTYGIVLDSVNPFNDSSVDTEIFNDFKLNTAVVELNFKLN